MLRTNSLGNASPYKLILANASYKFIRQCFARENIAYIKGIAGTD